MEIRFWGVRGSIAVSGAPYARTGGNTSCVEVTCAGERLNLDGGRARLPPLGGRPLRGQPLPGRARARHRGNTLARKLGAGAG